MERAAQLAEVAAAVYDKGGMAIRLPLDGDHPLVAVMSAAVRKEQVHVVPTYRLLDLRAAPSMCRVLTNGCAAGWQTEQHRRAVGTATAGGGAGCT